MDNLSCFIALTVVGLKATDQHLKQHLIGAGIVWVFFVCFVKQYHKFEFVTQALRQPELRLKISPAFISVIDSAWLTVMCFFQ